MASHFKWYPSDEEVIVPWNARYSFPSQANKAVKLTPRVPPKTGGGSSTNPYKAGNVIRLEFPAQGYVNPQNTTLEFDVKINHYGTDAGSAVRFQNNIQSIFSRVRLLYGATPIEDIIGYNQIVRSLTEWTATNQYQCIDQTSITEGIGGIITGTTGDGASSGLVNVRQAYIQGSDKTATTGFGDARVTQRRYQVNLALGLFTQSKLIPTKFMASQLAIEITLAQATDCMIVTCATGTTKPSGTDPYYSVFNVNLIPEILEFDASYDAMFLKGLREGGVPIKFSSWHTYSFSLQGANRVALQIQERSRSVKSLFALLRKTSSDFFHDGGATLFSAAGTLINYQYRIGGRYFPAAPVECSDESNTYSNGGCEAYLELQKALNQVGDYRLSTTCNTLSWALVPFSAQIGQITTTTDTSRTNVADYDYAAQIRKVDTNGTATAAEVALPLSGNCGSAAFAMAVDLETSNGMEISGLNAEEQSDISLLANYSTAQTFLQGTGGSGTTNNVNAQIDVYAYYDAMIILRENNVLELIQ